jgi:hypothetical protein
VEAKRSIGCSTNPPCCFGGRVASRPRAALRFLGGLQAADSLAAVKTNVYVDGFNLYYRAVKGTRTSG